MVHLKNKEKSDYQKFVIPQDFHIPRICSIIQEEDYELKSPLNRKLDLLRNGKLKPSKEVRDHAWSKNIEKIKSD